MYTYTAGEEDLSSKVVEYNSVCNIFLALEQMLMETYPKNMCSGTGAYR